MGGMELTEGWRLAVTDAGAVSDPGGLNALTDWVPAMVPGTAAAALAGAGRFDPEAPVPLHGKDIWYATEFPADPAGAYLLSFEGLATVAEVYLNGRKLLDARNMFRGYQVQVDLEALNRLSICFRALEPHLDAKGPRARWKPRLADTQGLRLIRTSLLGHMPGWCPSIHPVGPYRPVRLLSVDQPRITERRVQSDFEPDGTGVLTVSAKLENVPAAPPELVCCGQSVAMSLDDETGFCHGVLRLRDVAPWMPHTHGSPALHDVAIEVGGKTLSLGKTGFRRIEVSRGGDGKGFGLVVNGVPVFARGAVWTCADLVGLKSDVETYRPLVELARDAGMNMLRIAGLMSYESRAFFDLCDELGILVWQDFQFANYDYPMKDEAFVEEVKAEVRYQLGQIQGAPSLAVLCGGSEIYQQGAMMGLPESRWKGPLCEELLADLSQDLCPTVPYVPNSPCGGALPFSSNEGISHYYGVGAYLRPLEDARRADVRFAAECLAFANVPMASSLESASGAQPGHDPRWKATVPRDRGVGWDFEDVRDHYVKTLYGVDPVQLRYADPARYLDLGRAVSGEVMEATYAEWRRGASNCMGALVFTLQDLAMGAGWGVIDATGRPKPAFYALKRAFRPLAVNLTDEGTNGLAVHLLNETDCTHDLVLTLACLRSGRTPVVTGRQDIRLPPQCTREIAATDLIGAFFDTNYAYRFGPPSHDVTVVRLTDQATGAVVAEAFHFPNGYKETDRQIELDLQLEQLDSRRWKLALETPSFLQSVHLDLPGFNVSDNWFHMAPGAEKHLLITRLDSDGDDVPSGELRALNTTGSRPF